MFQKKYKVIILMGLVIASFIVVFISVKTKANSNEGFESPEKKHSIYPVLIPGKIDFAGEPVPIENFDTRESLDRELQVNVYWQSQTILFIKKANRYFPIIAPILKEYGIPEDLKYMALAESGLSNAASPAGAKGFWQFIDAAASDYGLEVNDEVDERYHIEKSTIAAARFLKESYNKYGSWAMAAASYNMGRANLAKQMERQKNRNYYNLVLGDETGRYLFRLISLKLIIESPADYGFYLEKDDLYQPIPCSVITIDSSINNIADFAYKNGINYKMLKELNPWLRDNQLTNPKRKKYDIKIMDPDFREVVADTVFYPQN